MAKTQINRGGSRGKNNNPQGRNQYSSGFLGMARERPVAAAGVAAGVAAAGVFLWSRRSQISEQLSHISDQIGEWSENREFETVGADAEFSGSSATGSSGEFLAGGSTPGTRSNTGTATGRGSRSAGSSSDGPNRP